jgi:hypothetical protein
MCRITLGKEKPVCRSQYKPTQDSWEDGTSVFMSWFLGI